MNKIESIVFDVLLSNKKEIKGRIITICFTVMIICNNFIARQIESWYDLGIKLEKNSLCTN